MRQQPKVTLFDYVCARSLEHLGCHGFVQSTAEDGRVEFAHPSDSFLVGLTPVTRGNPNLAVIVDLALEKGGIVFGAGMASIEVNIHTLRGDMRQYQSVTLPLSASLNLPAAASAYLELLKLDLEGKSLRLAMPLQAFPDTGLYERGLVLRGVVHPALSDPRTLEQLQGLPIGLRT